MSETTEPAVVYKDVPGFPMYRVGDDGSVWSRWKRGAWRQLKPGLASSGYLTVTLVKDGGVQQKMAVHRLVLLAFVGPPPSGMEACHYPDNCRTNNRLNNLRWDTRSSNLRDGTRPLRERGLRRCTICKTVKPTTAFGLLTRSPDGVRDRCHECVRVIDRDPILRQRRNEGQRRRRALKKNNHGADHEHPSLVRARRMVR